MDENGFFRRAALKICENLKIEDALVSMMKFLRQSMPVDKIFLQFFNHSLKSFKTVAIVTHEKGMAVDLPVPMSSKSIEELDGFEKLFRASEKNIAFFSENPYNEAITQEYFSFHKTKITSLIVVPLGLENKMLGNGSFFFVTLGEQRFTQEHADLLSLLKEPLAIAMSNALQHREVIKLKDLLADDNRFLHGELRRLSGDDIIGANFGLKDVMHKVTQVAPLDSPVLLLGETGVGKDVVANAIHYSSPRKNGPFITVNCGAIPDTLIDSELFGHEKGAFTGAVSQKRGRFERADKGTIFLDEIAELPLLSQTRLLHVLQNKTIERLGGTKTLNLDIRVIAATNQNLKEKVKTNQFREDLWFRLNVFPIKIPPLRDRKSDIPALLEHFISVKTKELRLPAIPAISPGAIDKLMDYHWPGNVRELENIVERTLILDRNGPLNFNHFMADLGEGNSHLREEPEDIVDLDKLIIQHIQKILDRTGGKIYGPGGAAALLGINPNTLRNRMKKLKIDFRRKKNSKNHPPFYE